MRLKLALLLLICLQGGNSLQAQKIQVNLFDEFTKGTVFLKNHTKSSSEFNYDAGNRVLLYMQGSNVMELTDNTSVDSVLIGYRKFVPYRDRFLEEATLSHGNLLIDWHLNEKYVGQIGAMGLVTNAHVQVLNTGYLYARAPDERPNVDAYSLENQNEYIIYWNGEMITFNSKRSLLKKVPAHKKSLQSFIKEKRLRLKTVDEIAQLINYLFSLK